MKLVTLAVFVMLVGCASSPTSDTGPVARCETTDCFYDRDVRDFEVIDRETLVVYVGRQRCPFVLELDGFNCDVTFTPQIQFFEGLPGGRVGQATGLATGQVCSSSRQLYLYSGIVNPGIGMGNDGVDPITGRRTGPGGFPSSGPGSGGLGDIAPIDPARTEMCRVQNIRSINDDQLVELYVDQGIVAPLPPVGGGELEVVRENDLPKSDGENNASEASGSSVGEDTPNAPERGEGTDRDFGSTDFDRATVD